MSDVRSQRSARAIAKAIRDQAGRPEWFAKESRIPPKCFDPLHGLLIADF